MNSGQILKYILNDKGKKQKWLADKMNLPVSTMSNLLDKDVSFSRLIEICKLLEISLNEFYEIYKKNNT